MSIYGSVQLFIPENILRESFGSEDSSFLFPVPDSQHEVRTPSYRGYLQSVSRREGEVSVHGLCPSPEDTV